MTIITRKQYMASKGVDHNAYFDQFVTEDTITQVDAWFGADRLSEAYALDPHMNNIPLKEWDALTATELGDRRFRARLVFDRDKTTAAGETITRAVLICIAKAAGRQIATW